jgi:murein DD-endopeptidase MepM/ murein hydrolase activator NlpD
MLTNHYQPGKKRKLTPTQLKLRWLVTLSTLPLLSVITAFGLVSQGNLELSSLKQVIEAVTLPTTSASLDINDHYWRSDRVQRGDTVDGILARLNVDDVEASEYLRKSVEGSSFRKLPVGAEIQTETTASGNLLSLRYYGKVINAETREQILIEKQKGVFTSKIHAVQLEKRILVRSAEIKTSLYEAIDGTDLPDVTANQLNDIFSGDIDFHHDLRKGDKFTVVYEMSYNNGIIARSGRIKAAEFINQGRTYRAVYFLKDGLQGNYYTPEGKSVQKAFLRSPIEFSRVSSGFSNSRFHPILHKWGAHRGVDFAAPTGTNVRATSDGVVTLAGKQNGYGNVVMLRHQGQYSTVYGHLSGFAKGLRNGQRVTQGEVIGYVGMSGLATGPHLHYEFKVSGVQRDPLRIALPDARPLDSGYREAFKQASEELIKSLNLMRNSTVAIAE